MYTYYFDDTIEALNHKYIEPSCSIISPKYFGFSHLGCESSNAPHD